MNVVIENKPGCLVTLQVELPADRVDKEWQSIARDFQRQARIPGYRPGKAPQPVVDKRFAKEIREEVTNKLLRESLNEAIRDKNLRVLTVADVAALDLADDHTLRYTATVVTAPEFELPDYASIPSEITKVAVTDEQVETWLAELADPHAAYEVVEGRPLAMGDFAVTTYSATLDGVPLGDAIPNVPKQLHAGRNAWIRMDEATLAPGFCEALVGMNPNDERTFEIALGEDFPIKDLAGKAVAYTATLHAVNTKVPPVFDDELAGKIDPGSTIDQLRSKVRERLERLAEEHFQREKRQTALKFLLAHVQCELPKSVVDREMNGILRDIIRENQVRGISDDELRAHQDEIVGAAQQSAVDRVRSNFLLLRIAEKEGLKVEEADLLQRLMEMASRYEIPVNKLVKDLSRRDGIGPLREQILIGKALDLLAANVTVRESAVS